MPSRADDAACNKSIMQDPLRCRNNLVAYVPVLDAVLSLFKSCPRQLKQLADQLRDS